MAAENGHLEVVRYLISQGADPRVDHDEALRMAAQNNHLKLVKYLISQGANPQAYENNHRFWDWRLRFGVMARRSRYLIAWATKA